MLATWVELLSYYSYIDSSWYQVHGIREFVAY